MRDVAHLHPLLAELLAEPRGRPALGAEPRAERAAAGAAAADEDGLAQRHVLVHEVRRVQLPLPAHVDAALEGAVDRDAAQRVPVRAAVTARLDRLQVAGYRLQATSYKPNVAS